MWKKKVCAADTTVCNAPCTIKKIALEHSSATTAIIYDEADGSHTAGKKIWTLRNTTSELTDEIDFGDKGCFFTYGCAIEYSAGSVLVLYN